jgi:hypothetical protein
MIDWQRHMLMIAEKLREIATREGNVPFKTGDLRKAHVVEPIGETDALVSVNTPYARATHDGRPKITIKPKRKKALAWSGGEHPAKSVTQPAREGTPWLSDAVTELTDEGLDFLAPDIGDDVADELTKALRARGLNVDRG